MTDKQEAVLAFILEEVRARGYQPSYREIMKRFGFRSPNGVACHIKALQKKGIVGESHGSRAIDLTDALSKRA